MKVATAFDHRGVRLREAVLEAIDAAGHERRRPRRRYRRGTDRLPGQGARARDGDPPGRGRPRRARLRLGRRCLIAASKIPGIRAAICHDGYSAHQGVEHDDMNVLCLGSEIVGGELARDLVRTFLGARFIGGGRYSDRLAKVAELERMSDG